MLVSASVFLDCDKNLRIHECVRLCPGNDISVQSHTYVCKSILKIYISMGLNYEKLKNWTLKSYT